MKSAQHSYLNAAFEPGAFCGGPRLAKCFSLALHEDNKSVPQAFSIIFGPDEPWVKVSPFCSEIALLWAHWLPNHICEMRKETWG